MYLFFIYAGESLFTVEKSLLYLNRINEEIESKKNDFDMLQKAKENESDDIFKFRKNVKKLTERYTKFRIFMQIKHYFYIIIFSDTNSCQI